MKENIEENTQENFFKLQAYQEVLDNVAMISVSDTQGKIIYVNSKFCQVSKFGYPELIGRNYSVLNSGYHDQSFFRGLWDKINAGQIWTGEFKNMAKDGSIFWVQATIVPERDEEGNIHRFFAVFFDHTYCKLEERRLQENKFSALAKNFPNGSISLIDKQLCFLITGGKDYGKIHADPAYMTGKPIKEFLPTPVYQKILEKLPEIFAGKKVAHELYINGMYYENVYEPITNEYGLVEEFVLVSNDITEKKIAALQLEMLKSELEESEQLLCNIADSIPGLVLRYLIKENEADSVIYLNKGGESLWEISHDQIISNPKSLWFKVFPEDFERVKNAFNECTRNLARLDIEHRIMMDDGRIKWVKTSGLPKKLPNGGIQWDILALDTTIQKSSLEKQKKLAHTIDQSLNEIYIFNADTLRFNYANEGALHNLGYSMEEISELDPVSLSPEFTQYTFRQKIQPLLRNEKEELVFETVHQRKDGSQYPVEIHLQLIQEDYQQNFLAIILDITQRKKAEELIRKNNEILTFRNTQLVDFCNIVSHNLRSPLTNISLLIGFIEESKDEEEKSIFIEKLKPVINNLNETFNELVESLQIKQDLEIPSEKIRLESFVGRILTGFEGEISKYKAKITVDFEKAPSIYCPPKYFSSILHNLISNALKYHSADRELCIRINTRKKGNSVLLSVSDNGLGINMEKHKDQLFKIRKVFHRHPDAKGFGLYITKTQVEAMGGKIWVESVPDQGSTFFIEFKQQYQ